ncbi:MULTISPECIES: hypothetical protein [unclassified Bradyrhizobium]|uniref:hypothetical protein n=1 Tax=unclassified Bradyrhizobium TaxID=2631580 RepID=UPI0024E16591|nr:MULTISPECIES: hypothetical protein [unclassified Bradyrhizobium]
MSAERIFNIFLYFDDGVASNYGVRHHRVDGDDAMKMRFLRACIDADHPVARRFPLLRPFTPAEWLAAQRHGNIFGYFEKAFELFRAPAEPVFCITAIVDGEPKVDLQTGVGPFRGDQVTAEKGRGAMPDYLVRYTDGSHFRFTDLINDDYFLGIRTLFNAHLHVSCAKLLMSCVDTLAFVEYGDVPSNFTRWLDAYVDLSSQGISSDELWEFRNSVLHMTNLASRKVVAGKISPIMPYVGGPKMLPAIGSDTAKPFNLYGLIVTISTGIGKWAESYNTDRDKFLKFIERYDTTISDSRMAWFPYEGEVDEQTSRA